MVSVEPPIPALVLMEAVNGVVASWSSVAMIAKALSVSG